MPVYQFAVKRDSVPDPDVRWTHLSDDEAARRFANGSDPLFHFSVLSGKLDMGSVANYKYLGIKGGEINIYRWGAAGAGAIYCESRECVAELMKKAAEADELFHPKKQEKAPTNLPEKVDLPN
jgi:hypothetical protein